MTIWLAAMVATIAWWLIVRRSRPPLPAFIAHWTDAPCADPGARYRLALDETSTHELDHALRVARGADALEHLRTVWRARELMRADFAGRQRALALDIYGPAQEPERVVLVMKRRRVG